MTVDSSFYVPNGKQQFVNGSGVPLANGKVYMYIPSTTTPKNTWQDPNQTTLNANPITLDSNGMALIYGTGDYRQQVYDQNSNLIWDTTVQSIGNSGLLQAANNLSDLTNPTLARQNIGAVGAGGLNQIISLSSGTTLTASQLGSFVELTGTGSFTTVLPTPVTNASSLLTIWNSSTAAQTISSAAGVFTGSFGSNGSTLSMPPNSVVQLIADGTNWNVTFATYMPGLRSWFQVTGNQTISQTGMNLFYQITGSSAYTLTFATPSGNAAYFVVVQNASSVAQTLSTPSGVFSGPLGSAASTMTLPAGGCVYFACDGTNWCAILAGGISVTPSAGDYSQKNVTTQYFTQNYNGGLINLFRNGTFDVWKRSGTSVTATTTGNFSADGWKVITTGASIVASRTANNRSGARTLYAQLVTGATSVTDVSIFQNIESYIAAAMAGRTVTVQFQVYNNTGSAIVPKISAGYASATDNFTTVTSDLAATNLQSCANGAWTQVSYTWTVSTSATNGYQIYLDLGNNFSTGAKTAAIAEADIRVTPGVSTGLNGSPPIPEMRSIMFEMAFNARYFQSSYDNGVSPTTNTGVGLMQLQWSSTTSSPYFPVMFATQMRADPTVTIYANDGTTGSISSNAGDLTASVQHNGMTGFTGGTSSGTAVIWIAFHYSATAEL